LLRHATVSGVAAHGAAISGGERSSGTSSCFAPGESALSAAIGACEKGQTGQHGWQPLQAMQHHDVAPKGATYRAAIGVW